MHQSRLTLPLTIVFTVLGLLILVSCGPKSEDMGAKTETPSTPSVGGPQDSDLAMSVQSATSVKVSAFPADSRHQAANLFEGVLDDPGNANNNGGLAMYAHAHGQTDIALEYYAKAAELAPTTFEWHYLNGVLLAERGDNTTALASFKKAEAINRDFAPLRLRIAELMIDEEQFDEARRRLDSLLDDSPKYAQALRSAGQLALDQKRYADAIEHLNLAVAAVPHFGSAHYSLANAYQSSGETELASAHRELFRQYQNFGPASDDAVLSRVENLRQSTQQSIIQAGRLSAAGKINEAVEVFNKLLAREPQNAVAHINLIGLYGEMGQIDKAEAHYRVGLSLTPDNVTLHNNYGVLMLKQKRYSKAIDAFGAAIKADPDYATPYKYLGMSQDRLGHSDDAVKNYRLAYEKAPTDHQAGSLLADGLVQSGHTEQAIDIYQSITKTTHLKTPNYLRTLAKVYYDQGAFDKSEASLQRARSIAADYGQTQAVSDIDLELNHLLKNSSSSPR